MRTIRFGFTPDPDDAFAYHALETGQVGIPGHRAQFIHEPIESLNRRAERGELDVAAVSSCFYPQLAGGWSILRAGASVGRGYGPALSARPEMRIEDLRRARVAVPGETTTGAMLLRLFFPGAIAVPLPFEEIREAVREGRVDAGVLIHEELLSYRESGLVRLLCLGEEWTRRTSLPLPVGLNVVHRRLGPELCGQVCRAVMDSMLHALEHRAEATAWALRFARGPEEEVALPFIRMFANQDTVRFPADCERGLLELLARLHRAGLAPPAAVRYVEPAPLAAEGLHRPALAGRG